MAFDDDDDPTQAPSGAPTDAMDEASHRRGDRSSQDQDDDDDDLDPATRDFGLFAASMKKSAAAATGPGPSDKKKAASKQATRQAIRRGEKDFESHGTRAQERALEGSLEAMREVLSYEQQRGQRGGRGGPGWIRGWLFPGAFAAEAREGVEEEEGEEEEDAARLARMPEKQRKAELSRRERRKGMFLADRVVLVEAAKGSMFKTMGRAVPGMPKTEAAWDRMWLLPEEALYLFERGTLDLWRPARPLEEMFPGMREVLDAGGIPTGELEERPSLPTQDGTDFAHGQPMDLRAAYAYLTGYEGERGKTTLQKYQVYAHLRRSGYIVARAPPPPREKTATSNTSDNGRDDSSTAPPHFFALWQSLFSRLFTPPGATAAPAHGPLIRPGLHGSYASIYSRLAITSGHRPSSSSTGKDATPRPKDPFVVAFHVWQPVKDGGGPPLAAGGDAAAARTPWTKTRQPPPDYYVAVVDARASRPPTRTQIDALLNCTPRHAPWEAEAEAEAAAGKAGKAGTQPTATTTTTTTTPKSTPGSSPAKSPHAGAKSPGGGDSQWTGRGKLYRRLKHGHRRVVVAVVDYGVVNFLSFAEGAFAEEEIFSRFDQNAAARNGGDHGSKINGKHHPRTPTDTAAKGKAPEGAADRQMYDPQGPTAMAPGTAEAGKTPARGPWWW